MSLRKEVLAIAERMDVQHCSLSSNQSITGALGRFADELRQIVRKDNSRHRDLVKEAVSIPTTEGPGRHHGVTEARGGPLSGEMVAFDFQGPNYVGTLAGHLYAYSTQDHKLHWLGSDLPAPKPDTIVQEGHSES